MEIIPKQLTPRYYRIYEELFNEVTSGRYRDGERFPSEAELCARFKVSRGTVREAIKMLFHQGLILREQGRGTFVAPQDKIGQDAKQLMGFTALMRQHGKRPGGRLLKAEVQPPSARTKTLMDLREGERVIRVERLRMGDEEPLIIERSDFVETLFSPLLRFDLETASIYELLHRETSVRLGTAEQTIEATSASPVDADLLEIEPGAPLLLIKRLILTEDDRSFQYAEDLYRSDRLKFTVRTPPYDPGRRTFPGPIGLTALKETRE